MCCCCRRQLDTSEGHLVRRKKNLALYSALSLHWNNNRVALDIHQGSWQQNLTWLQQNYFWLEGTGCCPQGWRAPRVCVCTAANPRGLLIHDQGSWVLQNTNYEIHLCDSTSLKTQAEALLSDFPASRMKPKEFETLEWKDPAKQSRVTVWVSATELPETLDEICCIPAKHFLILWHVGIIQINQLIQINQFLSQRFRKKCRRTKGLLWV